MTMRWSTDFLIADGEAPAAPELDGIQASFVAWVVVSRDRGRWLYVFARREVLSHPRLLQLVQSGADLNTLPLKTALDLHEGQMSAQVSDRAQAVERAPDPARPSAARWVEMQAGVPVAVGGADVSGPRASRGGPTAAAPPAPVAAMPPPPAPPPPSPMAVPESAGAPSASLPDEGTEPQRYPSIEPEGALRAVAAVTFLVDLLREETAHTLGGIALPPMAADWTRLDVGVQLQSPQIDFDAAGFGTLTVLRNAPSLAARISGRVKPGLQAGASVEVKAKFLLGTRFCGSAARTLALDGGAAAAATDAAAQGVVQLDAQAAAPDLTVFVTGADPQAPGKQYWLMVMPAFASRPPKLDGRIDLGRDPAQQATALFKQFAKLDRGAHREAIEGFGEKLWQLAPPEFQAGYWALVDHLKRRLTIQFISDDPYLPWELMCPFRDGQAQGPLALEHDVARWINRWRGYMRNRLPGGSLLAMAPRYSAGDALPLAQQAAQALVDQFGAQRLPGTRERLLQLLEQPPAEPVALLYFTGHGAFAADTADASRLKLEDGASLSALEAGRQKVVLGERHGSVVFLNACEVGASGSVLGNVGGWADALLSRRFGALIAPLWAIDEEDAAQVTAELMQRIVTDRVPLGQALRELRVRHGEVSPTFYSYLLYGDVTARLG